MSLFLVSLRVVGLVFFSLFITIFGVLLDINLHLVILILSCLWMNILA